jgi:hypothetical protein
MYYLTTADSRRGELMPLESVDMRREDTNVYLHTRRIFSSYVVQSIFYWTPLLTENFEEKRKAHNFSAQHFSI